MFISKSRHLPTASTADRTIAATSSAHCTAFTVIGTGKGRVVQAESHDALCHLHVLAARPDVVDLREEVLFTYGHRNERKHFFDAVATFSSGSRVAFTMKPEARLASGKFIEEMREVAYWVGVKGFADTVRLLSDADIDRTALHNANTLSVLRDQDPEADARAREVACRATGGVSLRDLTVATGLVERGYRALLRLMHAGELSMLERERVSPATLVQWKGYSL